MDSAFHKLNVPPELACEFLGVFARSEFALKFAGFTNQNDGKAEANWDTFAKAIANDFNPSKSPELKAAVDYLLKYPPKKQVLKNKKLEFVDAPSDKNQSTVQQLLLMVRRVRNNLFHGGKFVRGSPSDPERDMLLVQHSLAVLYACILLRQDVHTAYNN